MEAHPWIACLAACGTFVVLETETFLFGQRSGCANAGFDSARERGSPLLDVRELVFRFEKLDPCALLTADYFKAPLAWPHMK